MFSSRDVSLVARDGQIGVEENTYKHLTPKMWQDVNKFFKNKSLQFSIYDCKDKMVFITLLS